MLVLRMSLFGPHRAIVSPGLQRQTYPWSSAAAHAGDGPADRLTDARAWNELGLGADWEQRLRAEAAGGRDGELREATFSGLPFGDERFVKQVEERLGRRLHPLPPGPPPRANRAATAGTKP